MYNIKRKEKRKIIIGGKWKKILKKNTRILIGYSKKERKKKKIEKNTRPLIEYSNKNKKELIGEKTKTEDKEKEKEKEVQPSQTLLSRKTERESRKEIATSSCDERRRRQQQI